MRKVSSGQFWQPRSVAEDNAIAEVADHYRRRQRLSQGTSGDVPVLWTPSIQRIRNGSGSDRITGDILAINYNAQTVDFDETVAVAGGSKNVYESNGTINPLDLMTNLILSGVKPSTGSSPIYRHVGRFAVLLEPIKATETGLCVIDGLAAARLTMDHEDHPYADIAHNSTRLTSNWYGSAEIIHWVTVTLNDDVTEETWGLVRMGPFQAPIYKGTVTEIGGIGSGTSGDVDIFYNVYYDAVTSTTITAHRWMEGANTVENSAECLVRYFRDEGKWYITEQEC